MQLSKKLTNNRYLIMLGFLACAFLVIDMAFLFWYGVITGLLSGEPYVTFPMGEMMIMLIFELFVVVPLALYFLVSHIRLQRFKKF